MMSDARWTAGLAVVLLLVGGAAAAEETSEYPPLDRTAVPTVVPSVGTPEDMLILTYTYASLNNFTYRDDTTLLGEELAFEGGGLHTIGLSWKNTDGGGGLISFGFSNELTSPDTSQWFGGYGTVEATLKRYEFDITGFSRGESLNGHFGLKYIQTALTYGLSHESYDFTNHYFGLLVGLGGNHPLSKGRNPISLYWAAQAMGLLGWTATDYWDEYGYYYDEDETMTEAFFAGGLNGALGLQMHLGDNFTVGAGYKGQYLAAGDITESFHGLMLLGMIRF